jgi:hypothetical protein
MTAHSLRTVARLFDSFAAVALTVISLALAGATAVVGA